MTTKVTIDAHAGWDVNVEAIDTGVNPQNSSVTTEVRQLGVVLAGEVRDFHVWQGRQLVIRELPRA